ncbi:uncharacterized protein LOC143782628 [Ranitomeya variabilis]|uniref:uncharacterized protein LOC143782628 n=1 Tax=Ranitomeya variabilis TaxID=490064 RepID=UPI0040568842
MECESSFSYGVCNTSLSAWTNDLQSNSTAPKRKRYDNGCSHDFNGCKEDGRPIRSRATCFVQMLPNKGIFQSEKWKPNGSTLYYPVTSHLLVNLEKYDQISFDEGMFFIGDDSGGCSQKEQGHVLHCWRFDDKEKTLFIAMSYLFTKFSTFQEVVSCLN